MRVRHTNIPDVVVFEPTVYVDDRGFFVEAFRQSWFDTLAVSPVFVQANHSRSRRGVVRGMHCQTSKPQGKLVMLTQGETYNVAVDLRLQSPTYGQWVGELLSAENHRVMWIPEGFAFGFLVMSDVADYVYQCTDYYAPNAEISLAWNDPVLAIEWPLMPGQLPQLSGKDIAAPAFCRGMGFQAGQWKTE